MENFESESYRENRILHFLFQAPIRLRRRSKVNLKSRRKYVKTRFDLDSNFLRLLYGNLKIFEHESCFTLKMLQIWFWAKFRLSYGSKIIFKSRLVKFEFIQHFM